MSISSHLPLTSTETPTIRNQTSAHFQLGDWLLSAFFLHDAS